VRGDRFGGHPRAGGGGAGHRFAVGRGGPVFEGAFAHRAAVRVDGPVQGQIGRASCRGGVEFDDLGVRGNDCFERVEFLVGLFARAAGVFGDELEVLGGVGAQAADVRGDRFGGHPRAGGGGAGRRFAVGRGGPVFEGAFAHRAAVRVDGPVQG